MKILARPLLLGLLFATPLCEVSVASELVEVRIEKILVSRAAAGRVFIRTNGTPTQKARIACHTDTIWDYVLPLVDDTDKAALSLLIAAHTSRMAISLAGTNTCDAAFGNAGVETLSSVMPTQP